MAFTARHPTLGLSGFVLALRLPGALAMAALEVLPAVLPAAPAGPAAPAASFFLSLAILPKSSFVLGMAGCGWCV